MTEESWSRATRGGIVWNALTFAASKGLTFVSIVVLARLLAPDEFGVVAAIVVFLALLELGSDLGLRAAVVYEQERGVTDRVQTAFTANLLLASALTGVAVLAAPWAAAFFDLEEETWLFRLAALNLVLTALGNIHDSLLLRGLDFRRRIRPELARGVIRGATSVVLAALGFGAESLVYGMLAGTAAWSASLWLLTALRPTLRLETGILRSMARYGVAAAALEVVSVIGGRFDAAAIGRVLGDRALGIYTVAFRVPELLVSNVAWTVSKVAFPALSRKRVSDEEGLLPATLVLLRYMSLYAVPTAVGLSILATPAMVVLFGERWESGGAVMAAIALYAAGEALTFPLGDMLKATGRQRWLVIINLVHNPASIVAIVLLAERGIGTIAWVRTVSEWTFFLILVGLCLRQTKLRASEVLVALGPAVVTAGGVALGAGAVRLAWPDHAVGPLLCGVLAGAVGGFLLLRLGAASAYTDLRRQIAALRPSAA